MKLEVICYQIAGSENWGGIQDSEISRSLLRRRHRRAFRLPANAARLRPSTIELQRPCVHVRQLHQAAPVLLLLLFASPTAAWRDLGGCGRKRFESRGQNIARVSRGWARERDLERVFAVIPRRKFAGAQGIQGAVDELLHRVLGVVESSGSLRRSRRRTRRQQASLSSFIRAHVGLKCMRA